MIPQSGSIAIDYATPANALMIHDWSKTFWFFHWRKFNSNGMINNFGFMWALTHDYSVKNILADLYTVSSSFSSLTISCTRYVSAIRRSFYLQKARSRRREDVCWDLARKGDQSRSWRWRERQDMTCWGWWSANDFGNRNASVLS
jgi:hypothetical protein